MTWGREGIPLARLRQILQWHRGAKDAITARDLARLLGLRETDGRSIREAVNLLLEEGLPVGSSTRDDETASRGYFLVTTDAELAMCVAQYQARAREDLRKADLLGRAFRHGPGQASLPGLDSRAGSAEIARQTNARVF